MLIIDVAWFMSNLLNLYLQFWKNSFNFKGRISRLEYIWTSVLAFLPALIWYYHQWYLDFVLKQVRSGNFLFPAPPGIYLFYAVIAIPVVALNCRRFIDAGVDRRWLFAYFATNIGSSWVTCLALRPSLDADQSSLHASKAFQRRKTDTLLLLISSFLFPPSSLFFGIRRRSVEIALMPIAGSGAIFKLVKSMKYFGGIDINPGVEYLFAGSAAAIVAYFVDKYVKETLVVPLG